MKKREEIRWIIILSTLFLIGYFFTWRNFQDYQEKKQKIEEEILVNRLKEGRKKELEQHKIFLEKKKQENRKEEKKEQEIVPFRHILEFEILLLEKLEKNSLELLSVSRVIFDGNFVKIQVQFQGEWDTIFSFLTGMENNRGTIILSDQYLKIEGVSSNLGKVSCTFVIQIEEDLSDFDFLLVEKYSLKKSYIKLGAQHVYF